MNRGVPTRRCPKLQRFWTTKALKQKLSSWEKRLIGTASAAVPAENWTTVASLMTISSIRLLKSWKGRRICFRLSGLLRSSFRPSSGCFGSCFYAGSSVFAFKPGAAVVSARRAGTTASLDVINKYFTISKMPVVSSSYWNNVHGISAEQVSEDKEGLQTMRNIGHNMAWMLKCIEKAKNNGIELPRVESGERTNFIR